MGNLAGDLAHLLRLPRISGYLAAGFLLGPYGFGLLTPRFLEEAHPLIDASLSLITYLIGGTLRWARLRAFGKAILAMALAEATFAALLTSVGMALVLHFLFQLPWPDAAALGALTSALAAPTDPTAILAVVHEHHGPQSRFATTLLGITALDDALGVLFYVPAVTVAGLLLGRVAVEGGEIGAALLVQFGGALALGAAAGGLLALLGRWAEELKALVTATLGLLLLVYAVATWLGAEPLLATMATGATLTNLHLRESVDRFFRPFEAVIEDLFFTSFFVLSGAMLAFRALGPFLPLVPLFVLLRLLGKTLGISLAGRLGPFPPPFRRALGLSLMPQGGIVIGLALLASQELGLGGGHWLVGLVITATFLHEVVGPLVVAYELRRWSG